MVEKLVNNQEIVRIENNGIDLNLLRKRSDAKTFPGWLISEIKKFSKVGEKIFTLSGLDMAKALEFIYNKHKQLTSDEVYLKDWKGKSDMQVFIKPNSFDVITWQREDQDSKPKEIRRNIPKEEVNRIILIINKLNNGEKIPTRIIGEEYYKEFWDKIFANRHEHTELNLILRLLDHYKITHYRGGYSLVLKPISEIEEALE